MYPLVTRVVPRDDFMLDITFSNGECGVLDMKPYLGFGVFNRLNDRKSFEKVTGQKLNYKIVGRREGDITEAYANTDKANTILRWKTTLNLDDSLKSAWKWEQKIRS